jgi:predicted Zn-dependent peptidase
MKTDRRIITGLTVLALLLAGLPAVAQQAKVPVQEVTLDNGLKLLMVQRHESPTVSGGWVAHVGSVNERPGITGTAHLFEHMMFKGTQTIGTKDYSKEKPIIARLDALRQEMEQEYAKLRDAKRRGEVEGNIYAPENETERLKTLRAEMKKLQGQEHELIVKDELDKIYTENGASGLNAFTDYDMTTFFVTVPSNKLELWFWMESDRLLHPVFREFYSERDVVREERRMRVESDPIAKYEEQYDSMFWTSVPYHHPVIGWPSDVESISRQEADRFFATYYAPNNITVALVGDFDPAQAVAFAKKYLGRIPRGKQEPPEIVTQEIPQLEQRRMSAEAETNPTVEIRWHTVPFVNKDKAAVKIMADLLSGRTGRLYKSLVESKHVASGEPYAWSRALKYGGAFEIGAEVADGHTHQEVEDALLAEISRLQSEPVADHELQKVKNQSLADSYRRLRSNFYLMLQLLIYDAEGDWHALNDMPGQLQAVKADDVMRVAKAYFTPTGRNVMWYSRKAGAEEDPGLAALEGQAKVAAKQMLARVSQVNDPSQLQEIISKLDASQGQAPPEFKPAVELVLERARQRLEKLQSATSGKEK